MIEFFKKIGFGTSSGFLEPLKVVNYFPHQESNLEVGNLVSKMRKGTVDAVIVRDFVNNVEIKKILDNLWNQEPNAERLVNSKTFPETFAIIDSKKGNIEGQLSRYFELCNRFRETFRDVFEVDIEHKLNEVFDSLNSKGRSHTLRINETESFIPFTIRMIVPQKNHIDIHCGNQFIQTSPEFYAKMAEKVNVHNQLSFFLLLEKPESGGELSIYNVGYDKAKTADLERQEIILEDGTRLSTQDDNVLYKQKMDLNEGDLIIFSAGNLWHRVQEVYGSKMRITLGGFLGYSKQNADIYFWS